MTTTASTSTTSIVPDLQSPLMAKLSAYSEMEEDCSTIARCGCLQGNYATYRIVFKFTTNLTMFPDNFLAPNN
jgi:hypothetical protein